MEERTYELESTNLFTVAAGSGELVLCLHGITANAFVYEPVMQALAARFRVVSVDQRGHGRSGRPQGYAAADYAADAAALVQAIGQGPAILLGHSLGARNAIVAANLHPEAVRAVVALDFTPFIETEVMDQLEARVRGGDRLFASTREIEAYLAQRYPLLPAEAIARRARHGYREVPDGYRALAGAQAMAATVAGLREPLEQDLQRLGKPAALVRGALSKLVSKDAWAKTRALRPDLAATEVAGVDHYVPEEAPAAVAALVAQLADRLREPLKTIT